MAARFTHDVDGMIAMYRLSVNAGDHHVFSFVLAESAVLLVSN
jgi:hypothetical protein